MVFGHGGFDDQARRDEELRLQREERERIEREDRERQELMEERRRQAEEYPAHQKHAQRATDGTFQERFEALESPERLTLRRDRDWVEDDEAGRRAGSPQYGSADAKDLARVRPGAEGKDAAGADADDSAATWDEELEAMRQQEQELAERRAALNPRRKSSGLDDEDDEEEDDEDGGGAGGGGDDDFAATGGGSSPAAAIAALLLVLIGAAAFYFGWYLPGQRERQSEPQQPQPTSLSSAELPLAERGADLSNPLNVEPELPQPEADATEDDASAAADAAEAQAQPAEPAAQSGLPAGVTAEDFSTSPQRSAAAADEDTDNDNDADDEADASADEAAPPWNAADFLGAVPNTAAMPGAPAEDDAADREDGDAEDDAAQDEQDAADNKQDTAERTAAPAETAAAAAAAAAEQEAPEAVADDAQTRDTEQGQLEQLTTRVAALESTLGELTQHLQSRAAARAAPAKKSAPPAPPKRLTDDSGVHPVLLSVDAWGGEPSVMVGTTAPGDKRVRVMRAGDTYNGIHLESIGSDGTSAVFTASDGVRVTLNLNQQDSQQ